MEAYDPMSTKRDQAYDLLLERINDGTYPAQAYIDDKAIAAELKTSRTPVREAILTLAHEGYLKLMPQRGVIVLPFTYEDACDIFQTRKLIEPWLIRTYGPTFSRDRLELEKAEVIRENLMPFVETTGHPHISMMHHPHTLLIDACRNQFIRQVVDRIEQQCIRIPNDARTRAPYVSRYSADELRQRHVNLIDLMIEGKYDEAAEAMVEHLEEGEREYMSYWFNA